MIWTGRFSAVCLHFFRLQSTQDEIGEKNFDMTMKKPRRHHFCCYRRRCRKRTRWTAAELVAIRAKDMSGSEKEGASEIAVAKMPKRYCPPSIVPY
uniref:Secreted protein n=1 Tax=Globodera pallida TaxID=36090 RepID=A0A183BSD2_GLOPA